MKILMIGLLAIILIILVAAIGMIFFWLGWNAFVAPIFAMPEVTLWQSFCAMLIIGIVGSAVKASINAKSD